MFPTAFLALITHAKSMTPSDSASRQYFAAGFCLHPGPKPVSIPSLPLVGLKGPLHLTGSPWSVVGIMFPGVPGRGLVLKLAEQSLPRNQFMKLEPETQLFLQEENFSLAMRATICYHLVTVV